jgi:hypothetical protein
MDLKKIAEEIREIIQIKQNELGLTFTEDTHSYTMMDLDGTIKTNFPSVSKVIKKFYDEFPTEEAAYKKSGGDPDEMERLIKEWAAAGDYSTNMGSRVHYLLEKKTIETNGDYKEVRQPIFDCDIEQILKGDSMVSAGTKFLKLMNDRGAILLDTEMVLGHPELGYTGQPDKVWLIFNKEGTEFGLIITDWKTNKEKNFQTNGFTKPMYKPFNNYPNNALGHYFLQLPFYGKLLLKMLEGTKYGDIKLYGCIIVHLKENSEYQEYRVPKDVVTTIMDMDIKKYLTTLSK